MESGFNLAPGNQFVNSMGCYGESETSNNIDN